MNSLLLLFFAHCIGDFVFQSEWMAKQKTRGEYCYYIIFIHSFIWAGCIGITLYVLNSFNSYLLIFLLLGHFGSDAIKAKQTYLKQKPIFFLDQLWHVIQLEVVYLLK
jgi:hypothetical protein